MFESTRQFFREYNLYYQWLVRRSAQPFKINQFILRILWPACICFIITFPMVQSSSDPVASLLVSLSGFVLVVIPIVFTFTNFLYYMPIAIQDDSSTSMLDYVFISPISTGEIVSDLRRFAAASNLKIWTPTVVGAAGAFFITTARYGAPVFSNVNDLVILFTILFNPLLFWWMLLETGLAAAALPRFATRTGLIFLGYVIPATTLIILGGIYIPDNLSRMGLMRHTAVTEFFNSLGINRWEIDAVLTCLFLLVITLFFTAIPLMVSNEFMRKRRNGYWK